ncbi:MAG: hypothetical protein ACLS3C_02625 [Oscillospiraceae bacterium]
MANGTERQLLIVDANGQTYTSGMTLLEQEQTDAVIEAVLGGAAKAAKWSCRRRMRSAHGRALPIQTCILSAASATRPFHHSSVR